jgi:6-phosphogluconolactonase
MERSNAKRQEGPHVHGNFSPDRKFVLSNDLGNDKVYSYEYNQIQLAQY